MLSVQERAELVENSKATFDQTRNELSALKKASLEAQFLVHEHKKVRKFFACN